MYNQNLKKLPIFTAVELAQELGIYVQPTKTYLPKIKRLPSNLFLKGPIPLNWLSQANALGGSTGIVATGLWLYVGLNHGFTFKIDSKLDQFTHITRQTRQPALQKLQYAGLLKIIDKPGAYPTIEILNISPKTSPLHRSSENKNSSSSKDPLHHM